jgi:hypothetical protein
MTIVATSATAPITINGVFDLPGRVVRCMAETLAMIQRAARCAAKKHRPARFVRNPAVIRSPDSSNRSAPRKHAHITRRDALS